MYKEADKSLWSGRVDSLDGELGKRWHQKIQFMNYPYELKSGVGLLGFECDEGVRRNHGRIGAKDGSDMLKTAMGNFAWHDEKVYDCGKIIFEESLIKAQEELALHVEVLLKNGHFPLVIGGGHEVAYGSFSGLFNILEDKNDIAIINFDAHFDLRGAENPTSGTPFNQAASVCTKSKVDFNYMVLGISKPSNTKSLFQRAKELQTVYISDVDMCFRNLENILKSVDNFLEKKKSIYISIDCDVFSAYQVPAVSAMASRGVDVSLVYDILCHIFANYKEKIKLVDIAEFAPKYDLNDIGKKQISRLIYDIVQMVEKRAI